MQPRDGHTGAGKTRLARATVLAVVAATLIVPLGIMTGAEAARIQPRTSSPTSTLAVIKTIGNFNVFSDPVGLAVNNEDDTVYVTNDRSGELTVINGRNGSVSSTVTVGSSPEGVAVNQSDDTVYVANFDYNNVSVVNGRNGQNTNADIPVGQGPKGIAVDQGDDTLYVTNSTSNTVSVIKGSTVASTLPNTSPFNAPLGVAVNEGDDTVYVTNFGSNYVSDINGRTLAVGFTNGAFSSRGVAVDQNDDTVYVANSGSNTVSIINGLPPAVTSTITGLNQPWGVAVDQSNDTVYVTNSGINFISVITGRTAQGIDDTVTVGTSPRGVAVDGSGTNAGLVYVANFISDSVSVIGRVTPVLASSSGSAGSTLTVSVTVPNLAAGFAMDDATISSVTFGGIPATGLTAEPGNTWTVTVPAGAGNVPVTVNFKGASAAASAGDFTYGSTPGPTPPAPTPASAPLDVTATAGDTSASVTWTAPASSGDYPISTYKATSAPGGRACLVAAPTLTCEITGLANRTRYTFTVQALTGAGWGATSTPSNAVTPEPATTSTIVITGYRGSGDKSGRVYANGTTTGLAGETVRARVKVTGETDYRDGSTRTVSANETFTWQRKTGKKTYVYFTHNETRSNSITIPAR